MPAPLAALLGRLFLFNPFRSLTMLGVLVGVVDVLVLHFDPAALTPTGHVAVQVLSAVIGVTGLRNALERARPKPPGSPSAHDAPPS